MRFFEKFLLFIFALIIGAIGAAGIGLTFISNNVVAYYMTLATDFMTINRMVLLIGGACLILLAILMLFGVVFRGGKKETTNVSGGVVSAGAEGDNIQVSISAVDCIIQQVAKSFEEVSKVDSKVQQNTEGIVIVLKVVADAASNIPDLAVKLQTSVKYQLENMAGLKVVAVKVVVADVVAKTAINATVPAGATGDVNEKAN